ncbi:helix-turn-helix transcriptional regulator [Streptomyces sp. NPDC006798]|uniref:helix-turn-helix domain-containing protein n=1 Tax=Streptomyces sp. NPDC006798 TaxID=3155462 RepID=UPI0033FC912D
MPPPAPSVLCAFCQGPIPPRTGARGRPALYCSRACRQAAYRERHTPDADDPPPDAYDQRLARLVQDLQADLTELALLLSSATASATSLVTASDRLERRARVLSAGLVHHARQRGITWTTLGTLLATSPETLRRSHRADRLQRLLDTTPDHPAPPPGADTPDGTGNSPPDEPEPAATAAEPTIRASRSHLAEVLSILHRESRIPLRDLANRTRVSASYLSRVFAGTDFPSWPLTERLATAFGADADVLHRAWSAERTRAPRPRPAVPPPPPPTQRVSNLLTAFGQILATDLHHRPLPLSRLKTTRHTAPRFL